MQNNILEVKNLTKKFGDFTAVDDISFSVKEGEILQKLFEEVNEDLSKNNREYLLKRLGELNQ